MKTKTITQLVVVMLLMVVNFMAIAQSMITPLPQKSQPQISEQTKTLFHQRSTDVPVAAENDSTMTTRQTAAQTVPATAKANVSATHPPENRANQQAYIDKIGQALKNGKSAK